MSSAGKLINREAEAERIERETDALIGDREVARELVRSAYRMSRQQWNRRPMWVFVRDLYVTGSTYAFTICHKLGLDPEASGRAALNQSPEKEETR